MKVKERWQCWWWKLTWSRRIQGSGSPNTWQPSFAASSSSWQLPTLLWKRGHIFAHIQMDWRWCISATAEIWYNHIGAFEMQCQLYLSPLTNVFLSKLKTDLLIIVDCDFSCQHFALINVKDDLNIISSIWTSTKDYGFQFWFRKQKSFTCVVGDIFRIDGHCCRW